MLAYAASRPTVGKRQSSPHAMLLVISAHVALIAVVMSAKMELPPRIHDGPIKIIPIKLDPLPEPARTPEPQPRPQPISTTIEDPLPRLPIHPIDNSPIDSHPTTVDPGVIGGGGTSITAIIPRPVVTPVHHDPRLLTPPSELKPPYPASKILSEEEAVLTLRLAIDERGRVVAVDPIGRADPAFLEAARRHLMAHWRYEPATDDGSAIASSVTVTLRFRLDG